jgi:hypothetical protein
MGFFSARERAKTHVEKTEKYNNGGIFPVLSKIIFSVFWKLIVGEIVCYY